MRDLTAHLRQLVVVQTLGEAPDSFSVTADQTARLEAQAGALAAGRGVRAIDLVADALAGGEGGLGPAHPARAGAAEGGAAARRRVDRGAAECASSSSSRRSPTRRRRTSLRGGEPAAAKPSPRRSPPSPAARRRSPPHGAARGPARAAADAPTAPPARNRPARCRGRRRCTDLGRIVELWPGVLEQVRQEGGEMLAALLADAPPVSLEDDVLVLEYPHVGLVQQAQDRGPRERRAAREALKLVAGRSAPCARSAAATGFTRHEEVEPGTDPTRAPSDGRGRADRALRTTSSTPRTCSRARRKQTSESRGSPRADSERTMPCPSPTSTR